MFPENTWNIYKNVLKQNINFIQLDSHIEFLEKCIKEDLIPKGLFYQSRINFDNDLLKLRCQKLLNKASMKCMKMTVNWLHKQITHVGYQIKENKQSLFNTTCEKDYQQLIAKMNNISSKISKKLKETKQRKLATLRQARNEINLILQPNLKTRRNRRRRNHKRKRNAKSKRLFRKRKIQEKQFSLKGKLQNVILPPMDRFQPFDNTNYQMPEAEKEVCAKGLKFIPSTTRCNYHNKQTDFERFARLLRLAVYHHRRGNIDNGDYIPHPWTPKSKFDPPKTLNVALEEFLSLVHNDLFSPRNARNVKNNLTDAQHSALKEMKNWNLDDTNPRMFRIQDKGARLTIEWKERYHNKVEEYLTDKSTFREDTSDPSAENTTIVKNWARKWFQQKVISSDVANWIPPLTAIPATIHANPKTHKVDIPYRFIISTRGAATQNIGIWTELQLKSASQQHPAYLKDTTSLLQFIEDVNIRNGPMEYGTTILTTRDIVNYYPSCSTNMCVTAVENVLQNNPEMSCSHKRCIKEAVEITMKHNNCCFLDKHYTQVDGATIGGPSSVSITDIFGAENIDKVIKEKCPYKVQEYRRYRDDTIDININSSLQEQSAVTEWLNLNINKDKIKFTETSNTDSIEFLDVKVNLIDGFLLTESFSKKTDIHQYLNPTSCHPKHIFKGIPKSVAIRLRRNCSDRYYNDHKFIENLREYKGYLMTSGYNEQLVDKQFTEIGLMKRSDSLKQTHHTHNERKKTVKKYRFVTSYEPAFPEIRKTLEKYKLVIKQDPELQLIFPKDVLHFQVTQRREAKNLKEILAPSKVNLHHNTEENGGSKSCGKQCAYCRDLNRSASTEFSSIQTGKHYKVRQSIDCESTNVIYLVTCFKHFIQGVGYTTEIKSRISNYRSHHRAGIKSCGITEHYLEGDHDFEVDFFIQPIVKLTNIPRLAHKKKERLEEFELYWQENLCTIEPHGMNKISEVERQRKKIRKRKKQE